jgi:hypothetical protein
MTYHRSALWMCLVAGALVAAEASATNYSLWIHGRGTGATIGNYGDFSHFGHSSSAAGVN